MTRARLGLPDLGDGVGLRAPHYRYLLETPPDDWGVDWFEIVSENFFDDHGLAAHVLSRIATHCPVVMHGVSLDIGGAGPLDLRYLEQLRDLAERLQPQWVSDHLCWTGLDGKVSHDLLPLPYTHAALTHVAGRVHLVQDYLGRPLVLENPSTYLEFQASEMPEWEFLALLADRTGCGLLLDVNNVHVAAFNHGFDPVTYVEHLPAEHIVQVHLAGCRDRGTHLLDTHDQPVPDQVWALYHLAQRRTGGASTLLEWDTNLPTFPDLVAELAKARAARTASPTQTPVPDPLVMVSAPVGGERGRAPDLAVLQRWMLDACTSPGRPGAVGAWREPAAVVRSWPRRSAQASVAVYAQGYLARLLECLRGEYPVLRALVGDQVFDLFARAYVEDRPPSSPTLYDFGAGFADYLEQTRPRPIGPPDSPDALPAALARLERARLETGRAQGVETEADHQLIDPIVLITASAALLARTPPDLRLLRLEFDVAETLAAADAGRPVPVPPATPTHYAVARRHYRVGVHVLSSWQHHFLAACDGRPLVEIAGLATAASGLDAHQLWAGLLIWLPLAVEAGMVTIYPGVGDIDHDDTEGAHHEHCGRHGCAIRKPLRGGGGLPAGRPLGDRRLAF